MPPLTRKRHSTQVEPNERRRKATQRRKRRFGAFKKVHELHTICDYTVACFVINQETGQAYSYRSTDHELWQPLMEKAHLLPLEFEKLLRRRSSGVNLEEASEDEDNADEEAEPYQTPSSEPPNEEIPNHNLSVIQQTKLPEDGISPINPHSVKQSSRDATNTSTAVKHTRDEPVEHQFAIPNDRRSTPGELVTASQPRLPSIESMTPGLDTTSTTDFTYVNSLAEEHHRVEMAAASATPLAKQARRSGRRSRKKRYANLKEEMKRLSRMQQIQEELDRLKAATSEVDESDFESDFFGHEEEDPNYRLS
ncbi:hypothetical protein K469DRAFT_592838 [Zopfia rhizophila CBS 207.26]|uniref:MADS-box domain-containing protein n=1 Tax=Zopfia rhizophila CBS 207.26 TaxID=1314779 RepID=A0A6A6DLB3_9PEZI|nr:hypothetical protein K469DRAFT_592838 [Zopfia rhizophila CBS 207.26]